MLKAIFIYLFAINVVTFVVYGIDKYKAKYAKWRISEATLLLLAIVGGSIGAWCGMKTWHHKTMHKKFKYGVPLSEQGKGYGSALLNFAFEEKHIRKIDVNEQNTKAYQFYINRDYHTVVRDEVDADGKPYPIIHLER